MALFFFKKEIKELPIHYEEKDNLLKWIVCLLCFLDRCWTTYWVVSISTPNRYFSTLHYRDTSIEEENAEIDGQPTKPHLEKGDKVSCVPCLPFSLSKQFVWECFFFGSPSTRFRVSLQENNTVSVTFVYWTWSWSCVCFFSFLFFSFIFFSEWKLNARFPSCQQSFSRLPNGRGGRNKKIWILHFC